MPSASIASSPMACRSRTEQPWPKRGVAMAGHRLRGRALGASEPATVRNEHRDSRLRARGGRALDTKTPVPRALRGQGTRVEADARRKLIIRVFPGDTADGL